MVKTAIIDVEGHGKVDILNPQPEDFTLEIIARALSRKCRYGGFGNSFYSVAQHSILLSYEFDAIELQLQALFHELDEVYLPDVVGPFKVYLPEAWHKLADLHFAAGAKAMDIILPINRDVWIADKLIQEREMPSLGLALRNNTEKVLYTCATEQEMYKEFKARAKYLFAYRKNNE